MPDTLEDKPKRKAGRPKEHKPPANDLLFAALIVVTNTKAAAYQAIYPKATLHNAEHRGALIFQRPGVADAVARFRALKSKRTKATKGLTLAQSDAAMLHSCLDIAEAADASAQDKAKAAIAYSTLRKTLTTQGKGNGSSAEDNTPQDLRSFLDAAQAARVKGGTPPATDGAKPV